MRQIYDQILQHPDVRRAVESLRHNRVAAGVIVLFVALVLTVSTVLAPQRTAAVSAAVAAPESLGEITVEADRAEIDREEVLWLARAIYSETKRPHEQELVAWVLRNRMETGYRGKTTYRSVVLDPWQFSAFNRNSPKRAHYSSLDETSKAAGFQTAIEIAERVATASATDRPFAETTRHFYSERSMVGGRKPAWAYNQQPVALDRDVDPRRFRFYADVA